MPDNFTGDFNINVMGATNPILGQNGQSVCGVNIHFDHEYLGDLSITLTAPNGQSVQLVGPIGFFGLTPVCFRRIARFQARRPHVFAVRVCGGRIG